MSNKLHKRRMAEHAAMRANKRDVTVETVTRSGTRSAVAVTPTGRKEIVVSFKDKNDNWQRFKVLASTATSKVSTRVETRRETVTKVEPRTGFDRRPNYAWTGPARA